MPRLTKMERLLALKALRFAHKAVLKQWLVKHNKKGVKYTVRMRREWIDATGFTHLEEREYCEPLKIKEDGELNNIDEILPYLSEEKMNRIFNKAGLSSVDFKYLSTHNSWVDRVVDYLDDIYEA